LSKGIKSGIRKERLMIAINKRGDLKKIFRLNVSIGESIVMMISV